MTSLLEDSNHFWRSAGRATRDVLWKDIEDWRALQKPSETGVQPAAGWNASRAFIKDNTDLIGEFWRDLVQWGNERVLSKA